MGTHSHRPTPSLAPSPPSGYPGADELDGLVALAGTRAPAARPTPPAARAALLPWLERRVAELRARNYLGFLEHDADERLALLAEVPAEGEA